MIGRDRRDAAPSRIAASTHARAHHIGFSRDAKPQTASHGNPAREAGGPEIPST